MTAVNVGRSAAQDNPLQGKWLLLSALGFGLGGGVLEVGIVALRKILLNLKKA
jgi:hypothetical protein